MRDVTISVPAFATEHLLEDLQRLNASVRDTGISGRYHTATHRGTPQKILEICPAHFSPTWDEHPLVRSNTDAGLMFGRDSALLALECILIERADWHSTMCIASMALSRISPAPFILFIGTDSVPQSVARSFVVERPPMMADHFVSDVGPKSPASTPDHWTKMTRGYPENAIAVIGMACRFSGADSTDQFWNLLTEGKTMLSEIPEGRFGRGYPTRSDSSRQFWGNFIRNIEDFDHGFFKKSSREALSMDPQQRMLLEIAYEALESSGYFAESPRPGDVGCYIGACAVDYDFNVASHPPSAYSATGTLRSFLSGKLSHYFGWSGPSLVLDTACSSSAVAIHTACTALKTGQCYQALAGGITLMTSPYLYDNFSAAHFLSPTGGSKPFSADADGYCRGEGGGLVVLKRLSDALKDGDHVLSVIAGSAVNQNDNCVPITVPHTSSQGSLYEQVTRQAGVTPSEVNFVEAHGTGTSVGDPIEMESIRRVFGGPGRKTPLIVSSCKGNIGHTESASGVAALIKATLQVEHRLAPRQALFKTLNPKILALEADNLCIPTSNLALTGERLAACVNNYGAAGSNAAMILLEAPCKGIAPEKGPKTRISSMPGKHPIQLAAASASSLIGYCMTLAKFCNQLRCARGPPEHPRTLSDLAFSLAMRFNQELSVVFTTSVTTLEQLQTQLYQQSAPNNIFKQCPKEPPLVLCFGGQVSNRVALDKDLWHESTLLRCHLDDCDNTLRAMGYPGLYPFVFQAEPVTDIVILHSIIFAVQYSCAKAWLESGLKVNALIGHSFGQLTALCVSEVLSLPDGLRLVAGRASLMQKYWGPELGTMIAVETDQYSLEELQRAINAINNDYAFEIACYNGPTSHVVVSDKVSAGELVTELIKRGIKHRTLDVPYGFHSRFTDPLLPYLEALASSLAFRGPRIPLETCTNNDGWTELTARLISAHTREPVYFGRAVQRLQAKFGPCTWLEAGSDSSIVNMARRALGQSRARATTDSFVSLQLNKPSSTDNVVDATVALWNAGHRVQYWNFHKSQRLQYDHLRLPPYTWEKSRCWLDLDMSSALKSREKTDGPSAATDRVKPPPVFIHLDSTDSRGHHFVINQSSEEYQAIVKDIVSKGTAICPSTLFIELASRAVRMIGEDQRSGLLAVEELQVYSLLRLNIDQTLNVDIQRLAQGWKFTVTSMDMSSSSSDHANAACHAEGKVNLKPSDCSLDHMFSRYERLTCHERLSSIANDLRSESLKGNVVYRLLASVIHYPDWYRGINRIAAVESKVVARVTRPANIPIVVSQNTTVQLPVLESFVQVASLHANCLHDHFEGDMLQFSGLDYLQFADGFECHDHGNLVEASWDVVAYSSTCDGAMTCDMFVYNAVTAELVLLMLGVHLTAVGQSTSLQSGLDNLCTPAKNVPTVKIASTKDTAAPPSVQPFAIPQPQATEPRPDEDTKTSLFEAICGLLENLADIPGDKVSGDQSFDDIGVDSLMMIEVISELSTLLQVDLPIHELEELSDIDSLVYYLQKKGCMCSSFGKGNGDVSPSRSSSTTYTGSPSRSSSTTYTGSSSPPGSSKSSAMSTPTSGPSLTDYSDLTGANLEPQVLPAISNVDSLSPYQIDPYRLQTLFQRLRLNFDKHAEQTGAKGFWADVYPQQADLVCANVVDTYRKLGCDLASLPAGQPLPSIDVLVKHRYLLAQLRNILVDSGLLELSGLGKNQVYVRTAKNLDPMPTATRYTRMLQQHPLYASDTKLLNVAGTRVAECLTGHVEPLSLLFGEKRNRELLANFYANSQFLRTATHLLADFVGSISSIAQSDGTLHILEVGAGTGATTKCIVELLARRGISFEYYFTDISQSLISQAKNSFSSFPQITFMQFDCGRPAPPELLGKFHVVISTNCIHATSNITTSTRNILPTLRNDGVLCLLEFTRNLYWFDLVFGLLEGWWLFGDGRQHALADEWFWDRSLRAAGFKHVSWTDGDSEEAKTLRLICAFRSESREGCNFASPNGLITKRAGVPMEEIVWKCVGALKLSADVYFPKTPDPPGTRRPIGTMDS